MTQSAFLSVKPRFQPAQNPNNTDNFSGNQIDSMSSSEHSAQNASTSGILDFQGDNTSPFSALLLFAQGKPPAFLPPEPATRCRGWGAKSLFSEDE